jgi:hypothetical protein
LGVAGLDMRPAWTCLIGIVLAVALNKCTEYYTGTEYAPVKSLAKSCETGHATNIIQGFAVGYESSVAAVIVIAAAILTSVFVYSGTNPTFVAYGVAMCGIGMLTLTGNTISMDVFGPVADNANGIGEMGYDKKEMGEANYKKLGRFWLTWTPWEIPRKPLRKESRSARPLSRPYHSLIVSSSRWDRGDKENPLRYREMYLTRWPRC